MSTPFTAPLRLDDVDEFLSHNPELEADGNWMPVPGKPDMAIKLRSTDSLKVRNKAAALARKHLGRPKHIPIDVAEFDRDRVEILATHIVADWRGFTINGVALPCTPENVRGLMTYYPKLRDMCYAWADERENYKQAIVEAIVGNSPAPSALTSGSAASAA